MQTEDCDLPDFISVGTLVFTVMTYRLLDCICIDCNICDTVQCALTEWYKLPTRNTDRWFRICCHISLL